MGTLGQKIVMKKKNVKKELLKLSKAANRGKAKEQGFQYGRYKSKVVPDKKKKASKEEAKKGKIDQNGWRLIPD